MLKTIMGPGDALVRVMVERRVARGALGFWARLLRGVLFYGYRVRP